MAIMNGSTRTLKVGAIGCGYWGPNLIRNFVEMPEWELKAVVDLDSDRLDLIHTRYPQIPVTTMDYRHLFALGIDAVAISTPPHTHHKIAKSCLEAGLHVMVEKPMTTNADDALDLIETAERHDRVLMVGHTFVYNPAVRALKAMMDDGTLGDIRYIDAVRVGLGLYQPHNVIWDLAPHDVSILSYLLDAMPEQVSAAAVSCVQNGVEDVAYLTLMFAPGVLTHVRVSWLDPSKTRRITVVGSEKMVIYDDVEPNEKLKVYDKGVEALKSPDNFGEFQFNYRYGDIVAPFIDFQEPLRVQAAHFAECVREGKTPMTDGYNGLRVIQVIEALQESLRRGGASVAVGSPVGSNGRHLALAGDEIDLRKQPSQR